MYNMWIIGRRRYKIDHIQYSRDRLTRGTQGFSSVVFDAFCAREGRKGFDLVIDRV